MNGVRLLRLVLAAGVLVIVGKYSRQRVAIPAGV